MLNPEHHKRLTVKSLKWNGLNQFIKQGLNIGIGIYLARLLSPTDFGLLGMVTVITGFIQLFNDFGFGAALIQKQDVSESEFNSVFWFNLATGICLFSLVFLLSSFIASFYQKAELVALMRAVSFIFIIQALGYVQNTLFKKALNFKAVFLSESIAMLVSGAFAIYMAINGFGVWSLVGQLLANSGLQVFISWFLSDWRPKFQFSVLSIRPMLAFSLPLMGSTAVNYTLGNTDKLLIGRLLGASSLGVFSRAYSLVVFPVQQLSAVISQVLFPSLAQIQGDLLRIREIFLNVTRIVSGIIFPVMGFAFVFAEPLVLFILGEKWEAAIPIFKLLTIVGLLQGIGTLVGNIFMALGQMRQYFYINLFSGAVFTLASFVGVQFGLSGITWALLIATFLVAIPQWYITSKLIQLSLKRYFGAWLATLVIVCGNVAFIEIIKPFIQLESLFLTLASGFCLFFISYFLAQQIFQPQLIAKIKSLRSNAG